MHGSHIVGVRYAPSANRPYRFIRHNAGKPIRQACRHLRAHNRLRLPGITLRRSFAHTHNRQQPGCHRRRHFGANLRIRFAMIGAAFRMAQNHRHRAAIGQHHRGNIPGMRPLHRHRTILPANRHPAASQPRRHRRQLGCRRAHQQLGPARPRPGGDRIGQRRRISGQPVHLPVTRNQWCHRKHSPNFRHK